MAQLIKNRQVVTDSWQLAGTDAAANATHLILPLADYLAAMAAGESPQHRAVLLKPEDLDLSVLQPHLATLPLIAMHFGSTGEGRGYTQARLLRERLGFKGELRAVGKVLVDQVYLMARCGFDAFDLAEGENAAVAIAQFERYSVAYQPGIDGLTHPRRRYGM